MDFPLKRTASMFSFAVLIASFFSSCMPYSSMQTAKTLGKGEVSGSLGLGAGHSNSFFSGIEGSQKWFLSNSVSMRAGVRPSMDIGISLNSTRVNRVFSIDAKRQLSNENSLIHKAVGFGMSSVGREERGATFQIPGYFSIHSKEGNQALYLNPQIFYYHDAASEAIDNSNFGFANTIGAKFGKKVSLLCEFSFLLTEFEGQIQTTRFGNIGIGFNVQ